MDFLFFLGPWLIAWLILLGERGSEGFAYEDADTGRWWHTLCRLLILFWSVRAWSLCLSVDVVVCVRVSVFAIGDDG